MWDRALSAEEVETIYNAGAAGNSLSFLLDTGDDDIDGLPNAWEDLYGFSNTDDGTVDVNNGPDGDPDMDGLSNLEEFTSGTVPTNDDTDGDTLLDGIESKSGIFQDVLTDTGTDPLKKDTDGDGLNDNLENGSDTFTNATMTGSDPTVPDSDGDTMPDGYEVTNLQNPNIDDSASDPDVDNLGNLAEFGLGTDPQNPDTDGDFSNDDVEGTLGTDPLDSDSDNDSLLDGYETNNGTFTSATDTGTNPLVGDTDGDGTHDGAEVAGSRDPFVADGLTSGFGQRLVAYWNFDNNLDDIAHTLPGESVIADNGTFTGPATDVFYAAEGLFGSSALEQNGGAGWVTVPASLDTLREAENAVTVSAWIKVPAFTAGWQGVITHGEGAQWRLARSGSANTLAWAGGSADLTATDFDLADDLWHHVVGISDPVNGITSLYVDGAEIITGGAPTISDISANVIPDLFIGANPQRVNREFNGQIDDLAIWGRALAASEVSEIYDGGTGVSIEDLLGGGTALQVTDITYNSNGGTPQIDLTWNSRANVSYGIYYSSDLIDWTGIVLENIVGQAGNTTENFAVPATAAQQLFFRIELTRPPTP